MDRSISRRAAMKRCRAADERRVARFKWVIGTPYFVQGTSNLAEVPILYFIKFGLGMGDAGGQLFSSLRGIGWFVKPLWGLISDRVPLFGYRRKSWYVLMACLTLVFWALTALLAYAGVGVPIVYLVTLNLAFATYAFVDVVCDALMVTEGRRLGAGRLVRELPVDHVRYSARALGAARRLAAAAGRDRARSSPG